MPKLPVKEFAGVSWDKAFATVRKETEERHPSSVSFAATMSPDMTPEDFNTAPTPKELEQIYSRGFKGLLEDADTPEEKKAHHTMMAAMPRLYDVFPWAKDIGKGKLSLPYLAVLKFSPNFGGDEAQTVGSCTVHGMANACEIDHANDALFGETQYKGRLAKENPYRTRGYNGHGWSCTAPCRYVGPEGKGGLLFRQVYTNGDESIDLSKLNEVWASNGRAGVPEWLEEISRRNKVKWVIPIPSMEEYRDAIAMGFGINVCSGQGFASSTDDWGLAQARGSWSHAMGHDGCDDRDEAHEKYGDMIGMIQNSWGRWNQQSGKPPGCPIMPVGSFFAKANVISRMLSGGDSYAMCGVYGWDRTGWEAFDTTSLVTHLRNSTTQDYYKTRQEKAHAYVEEALDSGAFDTSI